MVLSVTLASEKLFPLFPAKEKTWSGVLCSSSHVENVVRLSEGRSYGSVHAGVCSSRRCLQPASASLRLLSPFEAEQFEVVA